MKFSTNVRYLHREIHELPVRADLADEAREKLCERVNFDHVQKVELVEVLGMTREIQ